MSKKLVIVLIIPLLCSFSYAQEPNRTDSLTAEILLKDLPEVMVQGERPVAKMERGGLVYDMPRLMERIPAINAYEALTRIPSVAEIDGQLKLAGRDVTLVINGKATTLSAEEVVDRLKQMPTERLEKVEVLLSAPASYHVRGQVINIVTKDHYGLKQISGQLQGVGVFSKRSYVAGIGTLLYSNGRFSLDAMYSHPNGEKYDKTEYDAVQPLLTGPVSYSSTLENYMRILQHSFRAGMEYAFAPNNRLELAYTGRWLCPRTNSYAAGDEDTEQHSKKHNYLNNIDLGYTAPFGLQLGLSFTNYTYEEEQDLKGTIIGEEKGYRVDNHQKIRKWDFTADQSHSFNRGWGLSYGTRMQITQHDSWQKTYLPTGEPVEDETSEVGFTECIGSFYASLSKSWDKVSADLGFQVENYNTPNWDNWRVYPTLNVLWQANANHTLDLSLSSNSTYPSYWSLMNSVFHSSAYMELWGNPELNPESNFDVTLSWQFHKNYSITAYYTIIDKSMMQLPYQPSDRLAVIMQYVNLNYNRNAGLVASAQWKLGNWANGNASAEVTYTHDKNDHFHDIPFNRERVSGRVSATASIRPFPKQNFRIILQPAYQLADIEGVYDVQPYFSLDATLRWTDKSGKFTASLAGSNLTNNPFHAKDTWKGQNFTMRYFRDWANVTLSLIYKFGNYKEKDHKQVDTSRMGQ